VGALYLFFYRALAFNQKEHTPMAKQCMVSGKKPIKANKISFSNKKHLRRQEPNLQWKRFWLASEKRFVRLRVTARVIKLATLVGIEGAMARYGTTLQQALNG
jgi:large subunit ribosomal protein L28